MWRFYLDRRVDATGVSGTGVVAEGVQFHDGVCVMRWTSGLTSTAVYDSVTDLEAIHGHGGQTAVVWIDPPDPPTDSPADTEPVTLDRRHMRDGRPWA